MPKKNTPNRYFFIHHVIAFFALLTPIYTYALGVQDIEVLSALNQPLNAKVGLNLTKGQKIYEIKVKLASPKAFKQSGLEMPHFLTRLKFEPKVDNDGTAYIHITSNEIVREPFLAFLLEVNSQDGSVIREFALLLDPVVMNQPSSKQNSLPTKQKVAESKSPNVKLYGPVQDAEILWDIAEKNRPSPSISVNQMINAIYVANPNAFIGGDINLLKRGVTLKIPQVNSEAAIASNTDAKPVSKPEQKQSISNIVETPANNTPQPEPVVAKAKPSAQPQSVNSSAATKPETTPITDSDKPQSRTIPTNQPSNEDTDKLEVTAIPEGQIDEIKKSEGEKVYPLNEIEELRGAIADKSADIAALKAINTDLLQLQSALKNKIRVIRKELEETNKSIDNMSKEIETSRAAISKQIASSKQKSPPKKDTSNKAVAKPTTKAAAVSTDLPKPESKKKGINIATDKVALEQVKKLEAEIEELKAKQDTANTQKYLIILLLLILLVATVFILLNGRRRLSTHDRGSHDTFFERLTNLLKLPTRSDKQTSEFLDLIDTEFVPEHLEQSEMPFETPDSAPAQEGYYSELLAKLASNNGGLSALEPTADENNESTTQEDTEPSPSDSNHEHDIDRTLTSVDVYIAYRRFSEAEFALEKAIEEIPDNNRLKAKQLEIFAMKNDAKALSQHLEEYHHQLSSQAPDLWQKALQKCGRLIPDNPTVQKYLDEALSTSDSKPNIEIVSDNDTVETGQDDFMDTINPSDIRLSNDEDTEEIDMDLFFQEQKTDSSN